MPLSFACDKTGFLTKETIRNDLYGASLLTHCLAKKCTYFEIIR